MSHSGYKLVKLSNGSHSLHSNAYAETFHPGLGPAREAELLYVQQLKLPERLLNHSGEFVVWDIGLGAAANALTLLRTTNTVACDLQLVSFDDSPEPLQFALTHKDDLGYFDRYEKPVTELLKHQHVEFNDGPRKIRWQFHLADFPNLIASPAAANIAPPHAILFDAFSPARNPLMWTLPHLKNLYETLDPARSCSLATYSRSTMVRVSLLLAGFYVGRGMATGLKEETTVAANQLALIDNPLDLAWLERIRKSGGAEPLTDGTYRQAPLSAATGEQLRVHVQFT